MKRLAFLVFAGFFLIQISYGATGWFQDYIKLNVNGAGTSAPMGWYWIGGDPSYGTQLQGANLGTINSLIIDGCDMRYWADNGDNRTGGSFFYLIKNFDNSQVIISSTEVVWNHASIGGNNYQGTISTSINLLSTLAPNTTYKLHIYSKSWGTSGGDSWLSNDGANYVATFTTGNYYLFSGSGNWNVSSNWNYSVPPLSSTVVIDGNSNLDVDASIAALTINSGKSLTINSGKSLTVSGTLTNSAGNSGIVIKSDATGTGSLIHSSSVVAGTVERFITNADWLVKKDGWHFISSPVASQAISTAFTTDPASGYDFYCWYEPDNKWVNFKNITEPTVWADANIISNGNESNNSTNFLVGKGYMAAYDDGGTKQFTGTLNVNDVSISGLGISSGTNKSWHLLGNPFSSALTWDASAVWSLSNISGVAKIWNNSDQSYTDLKSSPASVIPESNGFMVMVSSGTGSLTIPKDKRTHSTQAFYKSSIPMIKLIAHSIEEGNAQESTVIFNQDATTGFDNMYDSEFLSGFGPLFYSISSGLNLSTNSLPELTSETIIPFNFIKNEGTGFTIEANGLETLEPSTVLFLRDIKLGIDFNLTENPVYAFTSATGDNPARFELKFGTVGINDPATVPSINAWYNAGTLYVANKTGVTNINVFNVQGQQVQQALVQGNGLQTISLHLPAGVYFAQLVNNGNRQTVKLIVN